MATECSYDYLFIYDGNSYDSLLLGTFSGSGFTPDRVLAKSGHVSTELVFVILFLLLDTGNREKKFLVTFFKM